MLTGVSCSDLSYFPTHALKYKQKSKTSLKHFGLQRSAKLPLLPQSILVLLQTGSTSNWVLQSLFAA